ncbi:MAG: glycosyltransferase family 4 protein [Candidatus Omnitrophota bacterium]
MDMVKNKIKILHVHTLPIVSGSGINTFLTIEGLDKERYEVELACAPEGALIDKVTEKGIRSHPIKNLVQRVSIHNDIAALFQLVRLIRREKYRIVHTHNSKAGFIGRLAAKIAGTPLIIHTIHGFSFHEYEGLLFRKLFIFLERSASRFTDKLITISEPLKKWGLSLKIGYPEQYITIYSGIEIDKFKKAQVDASRKRQEFGLEPRDIVVGVVAKLWKGKGHKCILTAARNIVNKVPNVKFMFVGEGYLMEELKRMAQELDLEDHVVFTGFRSDIPEITGIFDIALLISLFEGLGRVLLEAMVLGKPVIATNVGGIVDVVDDGKTGILISPGDTAGLERAIIKLLEDKELRVRMGEEGRKKIGDKFSSYVMVKQIEKLYESLL